jgi:hypothetical protein
MFAPNVVPWPALRCVVHSVLLIVPFLVATLGRAQTLEEIDKRDGAVIDAWRQTPLTVRRAVFVSRAAETFDNYDARQSNTFRSGEPLVAYIEPVAYGWKDSSDGFHEFGFAVDFVIKDSGGKVLAGQDNFANLVRKSRSRLREFFLTLTMNVNGAPPGDYVLEYKLRDIADGKLLVVDLPFRISG